MILAIGTQGNPNLLRVPGGDLPHVQYQLDDPGEYVDEHIIVIGAGDAGIENALGLADRSGAAQHRHHPQPHGRFRRAKDANVKAPVRDARRRPADGDGRDRAEQGRAGLRHARHARRRGAHPLRPDHRAHGLGARRASSSRKLRRSSSPAADREAFPKLSPPFESTVPGIYVIGALAGYPLIKHCMNQGYDVVEFINGNTELKPADEPILESQVQEPAAASARSTNGWSSCAAMSRSSTACRRCRCASSCSIRTCAPIASARRCSRRTIPDRRCSRSPRARSRCRCRTARASAIGQGSIFGEVGLISGRRRGATIRAAEDSILVEISRTAALKLMAQVPAAKRVVNRISTERQLLQMFGSGLTPEDLREVTRQRRDPDDPRRPGDHQGRRRAATTST